MIDDVVTHCLDYLVTARNGRPYALEVCIGRGNSEFPFVPWVSRWNGNGHGVIREPEWELLNGNGREQDLTVAAKFPHNTTVSVMKHDSKSVQTIESRAIFRLSLAIFSANL